MIPQKIDEKYLMLNLIKEHKDYDKENWFCKHMLYDIAELYDDLGQELWIDRHMIIILKRVIKDINYDYEKFKKFIGSDDTLLIGKYIAWLCEFDDKAKILKEAFEKENGIKVHKVHWKKLKKYIINEKVYQKQIYNFRCSSAENEKYFQEQLKKSDKILEEMQEKDREFFKDKKERKDEDE